jgi:hypothetical protein
VIQIQLQFATLAAAAAALARIDADALVAGGTPPNAKISHDPLPTIVPPPAVSAEEKAAVLDTKPVKPKAAKAVEPAPAATQPSAATAQTDAPAVIDYATLQKAVFKLAAAPGGRAACTELCASFGVASFKELAAGNWADALAAVNAKLTELSQAA